MFKIVLKTNAGKAFLVRNIFLKICPLQDLKQNKFFIMWKGAILLENSA